MTGPYQGHIGIAATGPATDGLDRRQGLLLPHEMVPG
jgi:hypothetical protein